MPPPADPRANPGARRPLVAVVGSSVSTLEMDAVAEAVGRAVVDAGARLVTGGRGGVMAAASRGARSSERWRDGDILAVLPSTDPRDANPWADIVLPTGLGHARNLVVVGGARLVVLVGGEAGSLSEVSFARKLGIPVLAVACSGGVAARLEGLLPPHQEVLVAQTALDALRILDDMLHTPDA